MMSINSRFWKWISHNRLNLLWLFLGVFIPLIAFGHLASEVLEKEAFAFDGPILLFLHSHATPFLDTVMLTLSAIGERYGLIPLDIAIFLVLLLRRRWGDAFFWVLATGGAALLNLIAKATFGRIRPDLWISLAPETSFSFPSGHAMGSMALVAGLVVLLWPTKWRWWVLIVGGLFVLGVGISRMYLGVHYPSDVLAGWAASLGWVLGVSLILYRQITKPRPNTEPAIT